MKLIFLKSINLKLLYHGILSHKKILHTHIKSKLYLYFYFFKQLPIFKNITLKIIILNSNMKIIIKLDNKNKVIIIMS